MPKKRRINKPIRRRPNLLLLVLAIAALALGYFAFPIVQGWLAGGFRVNPNARIDPETQYQLNFWVVKPTVPDFSPWQEKLTDVLNQWTATYPNVQVEISYVPGHQADQRLNEALAAGSPPDVFFHPTSAQSWYGDLQLPMQVYLDKDEQATIPPTAWGQSVTAEKLWSLPVAMYPKVMLANTALLQAEGFDPAEVSTSGWKWDKFFSAVKLSASNSVYGFVPTNIDDTLLRSIAASFAKPAALDASLEPQWTNEDLLAMAGIWQKLSEAEGIPSDMDAGCLDLFLSKKAAMIGPLNHNLAYWLWKSAVQKGITPALLPVPYGGEQPVHDMQAVFLSVFRQEPYQGHAHSRAAAELAQFLRANLAAMLSTETWAIPAITEPLADLGHLPYDAASQRVYAAIELAPTTPYAYGPEPGVSAKHWEVTVKPAWVKLISGQYSPEQFAQAVLNSLSAATMTGP